MNFLFSQQNYIFSNLTFSSGKLETFKKALPLIVKLVTLYLNGNDMQLTVNYLMF